MASNLKILWLDDIVNPHTLQPREKERYFQNNTPIWVKNFNQFAIYIFQNGFPDVIWFDTYLGYENDLSIRSGIKSLIWLITLHTRIKGKFPICKCQSLYMLPRENLLKISDSYTKMLNEKIKNNIN